MDRNRYPDPLCNKMLVFFFHYRLLDGFIPFQIAHQQEPSRPFHFRDIIDPGNELVVPTLRFVRFAAQSPDGLLHSKVYLGRMPAEPKDST
ncbi:MAG: hypothetical protein ACE5R6_16165 [Candidatus Heimdallarchaeota archaeon]